MTDHNLRKRASNIAHTVFSKYLHWRSAQASMAADLALGGFIHPMVSPSVLFDKETVHISFKNTGMGTALKIESSIHHPKFNFEGPLQEAALEDGQETRLDIPAANGQPELEKSFEIIVRYEDVYGRRYYSKLTRDENNSDNIKHEKLERKQQEK